MFKSLEQFRMAHAMASHAGARQGVIASNIANADTPGYRARDVVPFKEFYRTEQGTATFRATRAGHLHGPAASLDPGLFDTKSADSNPNGNSVSLEEEMLKGVEVKRQHDKAVAIYRSGLSVLRASIGRR